MRNAIINIRNNIGFVLLRRLNRILFNRYRLNCVFHLRVLSRDGEFCFRDAVRKERHTLNVPN